MIRYTYEVFQGARSLGVKPAREWEHPAIHAAIRMMRDGQEYIDNFYNIRVVRMQPAGLHTAFRCIQCGGAMARKSEDCGWNRETQTDEFVIYDQCQDCNGLDGEDIPCQCLICGADPVHRINSDALHRRKFDFAGTPYGVPKAFNLCDNPNCHQAALDRCQPDYDE
jgi:hypothetical protein